MSHDDNSNQEESLSNRIENSISSLMSSIKLNDTKDFYGCLLISQLETVEAVSRLDKQVSILISFFFFF